MAQAAGFEERSATLLSFEELAQRPAENCKVAAAWRDGGYPVDEGGLEPLVEASYSGDVQPGDALAEPVPPRDFHDTNNPGVKFPFADAPRFFSMRQSAA